MLKEHEKIPLNSLINVEGVIASHTLNIKIEGGENPLKKIKKTIQFDQIPKNKRGVWRSYWKWLYI